MKMPNVKMKKIEVTTTKSIYLNGLRLIENVEYVWNDEDKPKFALPLKIGDHLVIGRELDGFEAFEVIPEHIDQIESETVLGSLLVFGDWNALLDSVNECKQHISFHQQPALQMYGFKCHSNGNSWLIKKSDAVNQDIPILEQEYLSAIVNKHNDDLS